jgi:hypothetical protein
LKHIEIFKGKDYTLCASLYEDNRIELNIRDHFGNDNMQVTKDILEQILCDLEIAFDNLPKIFNMRVDGKLLRNFREELLTIYVELTGKA